MDEMQLPLYNCHKKVRAAKITEIESHESDGTGSRTMIFGDVGGNQFLTDEWKDRHNPEVGGYYVVYEDGYTSFSPAEAFEGGYTKA
jgi:hypothetical protein